LTRILPLLLALIAVLSLAPHPVCACSERSATSATITGDHSCCDAGSAPRCVETSTSIGDISSCCGRLANGVLFVATSVPLFDDCDRFEVRVSLPALAACALSVASHDPLVNAPRAPPAVTGLGSSKTYLFKRVLLI